MIQTILNYLQTNWLETLGIITTLICVWLNTRQNVWGWFWAIISGAIYGYIYWQFTLYSDMELQVVFIIISVYGWYQWLNGGEHKDDLPVSRLPRQFILICVIIFLLFTAASGYFHHKYTNAGLPYIDSSLTAMSLIAQWMMARKYIENWILWIVANMGYVAMYFYKELYGTSILYVLLLGLAITGYIEWKKPNQTKSSGYKE